MTRVHPTVIVEAADGEVELWPPAADHPWWLARVDHYAEDTVTEVAWLRWRDRAAEYHCAQHGRGTRRDLCEHTRAAVAAATDYLRSKTR